MSQFVNHWARLLNDERLQGETLQDGRLYFVE